MRFAHEMFTMGFEDARMYGIDYRNFEKVSRLPAGIPLTAIAGVWGDHCNIRCLFIDPDANGYRRHINGSAGQYIIRELGVNAKQIEVGEVFEVKA